MAYQQFGNSMSEEDLQRLASILRSRNEGLAAINQGEADLLKALGGAAEPMPGTQGMGPGGGPIRSYQGRGSTVVESSTERAEELNKTEEEKDTEQAAEDAKAWVLAGGDPPR